MALGKIKFLEATLVLFKSGKFFWRSWEGVHWPTMKVSMNVGFPLFIYFFHFLQINNMLPKSGAYISFKFKRRGLDMNV